MIYDNNYIQIEGWMINKLNLSGNELLVYALIYGFSQDGVSRFCGSVAYITEWVGTSRVTVFTTLKKLEEKKLITKFERFERGVKYCEYATVVNLNKSNKAKPHQQAVRLLKENIVTQKNEKLIDREPKNDLEKVEKEYLLNYKRLKQSGVVNTDEPIINWGIARKLEKDCIQRYGVDVVLEAIKTSVNDDFSVSSGYCLTTILSSGVLARLINGTQNKKNNTITGVGVDLFTGKIDF